MASHSLLALLVEIPTVPLQNDVNALARKDTLWTTKEVLVSRYGLSTFLQSVRNDAGPHADP
jgi:hypothetical protein